MKPRNESKGSKGNKKTKPVSGFKVAESAAKYSTGRDKKIPMSLEESLDALPKKRRARVEARAQQLIKEEKALRELRMAVDISQVALADRLGVKQAEISKMERRTDMYVSTLRNYIEALGGSLEIIAHFPGIGVTRISSLGSHMGEKDR